MRPFGWQSAKRNLPAWGKIQSNDSIETEKQALRSQLEHLRNQAERIEQRLQSLEGSE
jgi:prefoldin subunit 5